MPLDDHKLTVALVTLAIDTFSIEEMRHALWVRGDETLGQQPGTFTTKLLQAAAHADDANLRRLEAVFPVVMAYDLAGNATALQLIIDRVREHEAAMAAAFDMPAPTQAGQTGA